MNRKTSITLVIFIVLGAASYVVLSKPKKGVRTEERVRPIAKIDPAKIERVTITEQGKPKVVLQSEGEGFKLVEPVAYAGDKYATKTLREKLGTLDFGDMVTERKDRHATHQVDDKSAVRITVAAGGKTVADFLLGKVEAGHTMLRPAGSDKVYQAVGSLRVTFSKDLKSWRDRTIFALKRDEIVGARVKTAAGEILLSRKDDKASWKVDKAPLPVDQLDESVPRSLLSSFANLSAFDFADDAKPDKTGLDSPAAEIELSTKDGKKHLLLVGNKQKDDYWVKRSDKPQVFLLKKYSAENMIKRPIDFRDKSILSFKADDLVSLEIANIKDGKKTSAKLALKGKDWQRGGKKVGDETAKKLKGAADALAALKADRFAQATAEELGMKKPAWLVVLQLKDRTRHELAVGATDKDGFFGLTRKGVADLFAVRKYKLDKFLLPPDTLK